MPPNRAPGYIAELLVLAVIAVTALILRCVAKIITKTRFWWDDWFAILEVPVILTDVALTLYWISIGLGKHVDDVPAQDLSKGFVILWVAAFLYDLSITLPKFSVLFFYERVFGSTKQSFRYSVWFGQFLVAGWIVSAFVSTIWQCTPIRKAYAPQEVSGGHCIDVNKGWYGTGIASVIIDLYILVLPIPVLWRLQVTLKRRLAVIGVFVCGYSVVVVSIGRLIALTQLSGTFKLDITWDMIPYQQWLQCEGPISLISVCLPSMFQLGKHIRERTTKPLPPPYFKSTTGKSGIIAGGSAKLPRKLKSTVPNEEPSDVTALYRSRSTLQAYSMPSKDHDGANPDIDIEFNRVPVRNEVEIIEHRGWSAV
ncbi:MAG: hypothetical protein M1820_004153 [Bogoriella megaspora]|nr:MAG: hypothetical protein M1820_004153 [Bogoriella megaspora]